MGLDTTHDCWHGAYSGFMKWRKALAQAAGYPPLLQMKGFGGNTSWEAYESDPLSVLLSHSDCDGEIEHKDCKPLADRLTEVAGKLEDHDRERALQFADGLMEAHKAGENVEFR